MSSFRRATHSSLEPLEVRIAPAAITASVINGLLKIAAVDASTAAQVVVVFSDFDTIQVSEGGTALASFHGVHSMKITLSDQPDSLDFFGLGTFRGPVSISSGAGQDNISFHAGGNGGILGDVSVVAKGNALVAVQDGGKITGTLSVTTGGDGAVAVTTTVGALSTTNVPSVSLLPDSYVAGNVRVVAPSTGVVVTEGGTIGGSLFVKGSPSTAAGDTVHLNGVVHGSVSLVLDEGSSQVDSQNTFLVGDNLSISGKSGADTVNLALDNNLLSTGIGGILKISLGDGTNSISISGKARIGGGLRTSGGTGDDSVSMSYGNVGGVTRFDLGAGTNSVTAGGSLFNGGLVVTGGAGHDGITVGFPQNTIVGPAKFILGDGDNNLSASVALFEGGLRITSGKDNDTVNLAGANFRGKTIVALGEGTNSFNSNANVFHSNFTYLGTRAGNDSVTIEARTTFNGSFTMNAGDGTNLLVMNTLGDLSSFSYHGGKDSDTVVLEAGGGVGGSNPFAGQYLRGQVVLGDGADLAVLRNSAFLTFTLDGGAGADTIQHTADAFAAGPVEKGFETVNIVP